MPRLEADPEVLRGVDVDALEQFLVHVGDAPGRFAQAVSIHVLADRVEQLGNRGAHSLDVDAHVPTDSGPT